MLKEFKPTILFLVKFFAIYLVFSTLYGLYISGFDKENVLDPITRVVANNCVSTASAIGYETEVVQDDHLRMETEEEQTFDSIWLDKVYAVSVEEGCNGVNIMILFAAFVVGFGGRIKNMLWFIPLGLLFVHLANIGRLLLLSLLNVEWDGRGFHFFHKYGFTAVLYLAILVLWYLWVMHLNGKTAVKSKSIDQNA
jgi:exosortase family protein XrtF